MKKGEASEIFGEERDRGLFESALNTIYQIFGEKELYVSFEEKAAKLLYDSVTKICFTKVRQNQQQIRTLEKLRDTLLPKLMSGEVRVRM